MHIIKAAAIATLLAFCASCAGNVTHSSYAVDEMEMNAYGKAYWAVVAVKAAQRGESTPKVLAMLNRGIKKLEGIDIEDKCGIINVPCMEYMAVARLIRAAIYSAMNRKGEAVEDLIWLHRKGLMRFVVKNLKFWEHKIFKNLHGHHRFEFLVRIYKT